MNEKLNKILSRVSIETPPAYLAGAIFQRIEKIKKKRARRKLFLSYCSLSFSSLTAALALFYFGQSIWHSEFWSMLTLIFSDTAMILTHWKEFGFALLETLPAASLAVAFIPVSLFILSCGFYAELRKWQGNNSMRHNLA